MALERWDPIRRKWKLYDSQEQHSRDCERYAIENMPQRVFLDTNVINLMIKFREQVFEQAQLPDGLDQTKAHDVEALMHVFHLAGRGPWTLVACEKSLAEIWQTPEDDVREFLLDFAVEMVDPPTGDALYAAELGRRLVDAPFMAALPDLADRELIGNAIGFRCDVFCTCDRRTVVRKRDQLTRIPIRILTPPEWWAHLKPWARLWT